MVINFLISIIILAIIKVMESRGYFDAVSGNMSVQLNDRGLFEFYSGDNALTMFVMTLRIFMGIVLPILFMIGSYRLMKTNRY